MSPISPPRLPPHISLLCKDTNLLLMLFTHGEKSFSYRQMKQTNAYLCKCFALGCWPAERKTLTELIMREEKRAQEVIVNDIRELTKSPGYIVALCMNLFEDLHGYIDEADQVNIQERLSIKEFAFLISQFLQNDTLISMPNSAEDVIGYKEKTSALFKELHLSYMVPFNKKMADLVAARENGTLPDNAPWRKAAQEFFGDSLLIKEAITYSGTGVYDRQLLNMLSQKYKYDEDWLTSNRSFYVDEVKAIVQKIKDISQKKAQCVHLIGIKDNRDAIIKKVKKESGGLMNNTDIREMMVVLEFSQYKALFGSIELADNPSEQDVLRKQGWMTFYDGVLDLFTVNKSDFKEFENADAFFNSFSFVPGRDSTEGVNSMESRNDFNFKPMIKLSENRFFVPIEFLLCEAVYESPYYWMYQDETYRDKLGHNKGCANEEIVYDILTPIFGVDKTFKSIVIHSEKKKSDTDIDVLCVLGNKALCVQVKSKKLTQLARTGDDAQLLKDFKGAVQDAYRQGLICREKILEKTARFIDANGQEIKFADPIDEVYLMVLTAESYPALAHQTYVLLDKEVDEPFPIALTLFDLQLVSHYLTDLYDFLYYIRQRISLMEYFKGDEEISYIAYHLINKLCKRAGFDYVSLNSDLGKIIDQDYYYSIHCIEDNNLTNNKIKNSWIYGDFQEICDALKEFKHPKITDIIFDIFDYSPEIRDNLMKMIKDRKNKTMSDNKSHNTSVIPQDADCGFTYVSQGINYPHKLQMNLEGITSARKYVHKCNKWIGIGSFYSSPANRIDMVAYHAYEWFFDPVIEESARNSLENSGEITSFAGHKIRRNDPCPCHSGKKYKKCCGQDR